MRFEARTFEPSCRELSAVGTACPRAAKQWHGTVSLIASSRAIPPNQNEHNCRLKYALPCEVIRAQRHCEATNYALYRNT